MNRKLLSKAVGNIDDSFIAHMKPKRLFTLALAAALILSLGIAAYAVWSIHIARQQEIRSDLKIDENNAESYVEYSVADAQPHGIALLSAINDGEEQRIYLNVSPVAEEDLAGFPGLTCFYCTIEGTEFGGFAAPALPAELSLAGEKNIHTAVLEYAYDRDSQTLTLQSWQICWKKLWQNLEQMHYRCRCTWPWGKRNPSVLERSPFLRQKNRFGNSILTISATMTKSTRKTLKFSGSCSHPSVLYGRFPTLKQQSSILPGRIGITIKNGPIWKIRSARILFSAFLTVQLSPQVVL